MKLFPRCYDALDDPTVSHHEKPFTYTMRMQVGPDDDPKEQMLRPQRRRLGWPDSETVKSGKNGNTTGRSDQGRVRGSGDNMTWGVTDAQAARWKMGGRHDARLGREVAPASRSVPYALGEGIFCIGQLSGSPGGNTDAGTGWQFHDVPIWPSA